jgi:hypothetical protein
MAEQKPRNIPAVLTEIIEHTVAIEAENFYFRSALSLAKANPTEYGTTAQLFERCLAIVQAESERFDQSSAHASAERLRELMRQIVPPESR